MNINDVCADEFYDLNTVGICIYIYTYTYECLRGNSDEINYNTLVFVFSFSRRDARPFFFIARNITLF